MKKVLIALAVAGVSVATLVSAQGHSFNVNLSVGRSGADVIALQTALINAGFTIPSIVAGTAQKGYFGAQTRAAVMLYQASRGIPNTGFVGPLTRGALNRNAAAINSNSPMVVACPEGYICVPNQSSSSSSSSSSNPTRNRDRDPDGDDSRDTTGPSLINIRATNITTSGATITWTTSERANAKVEIGLSTNYGTTFSGGSNNLSHSVAVTGLQSNKLYYYRVKSTDSEGNTTTSLQGSFTTLSTTPAVDTTAPVISGMAVAKTANSLTYTWTTNEDATATLRYRPPSGAWVSVSHSSPRGRTHTIRVPDLTALTHYESEIFVTDIAGNVSVITRRTDETLAGSDPATSPSTSPTADTTAPTFTVRVFNITSSSFSLEWTSNEPVTAFARYKAPSGAWIEPFFASGTGLVHTVSIGGLAPATTYLSEIWVVDAAGNQSAVDSRSTVTLSPQGSSTPSPTPSSTP
jgi:peptidoglycan hydrolase-like protein with peptidoglycan-binding domain